MLLLQLGMMPPFNGVTLEIALPEGGIVMFGRGGGCRSASSSNYRRGKRLTILILLFSLVPGWVNKLALRVAAQVHKMRGAPVTGHMGTNSFSAFYALKDKRSSILRRCGFSDCQRFFNGNDVSKKLALGCD